MWGYSPPSPSPTRPQGLITPNAVAGFLVYVWSDDFMTGIPVIHSFIPVTHNNGKFRATVVDMVLEFYVGGADIGGGQVGCEARLS